MHNAGRKVLIWIVSNLRQSRRDSRYSNQQNARISSNLARSDRFTDTVWKSSHLELRESRVSQLSLRTPGIAVAYVEIGILEDKLRAAFRPCPQQLRRQRTQPLPKHHPHPIRGPAFRPRPAVFR